MDGPPAKRIKTEGEANVFDSPDRYGEFANSVDSLMASNSGYSYQQRPAPSQPMNRSYTQPPPPAQYSLNYNYPQGGNNYPSLFEAPRAPQTSLSALAATGSGGGGAQAADPNKLNDALAAAGVNIAEEEEILLNLHLRAFATLSQAYRQQPMVKPQRLAPFLNQYQLAQFMARVAKENGVSQSFHNDHEMLEFVLAACENWMSQIILRMLILSHHRRRGIALFQQPQSGQQTSAQKLAAKRQSQLQRLELSRELRNIAAKQKELEEKRVAKRVALGLEKDANLDATTGDAKGAAAEEALHRLTNETAAMMTTGKKKYAWMDLAGAGLAKKGNGNGSGSVTSDKNKQSALITARGDNGLRYREIRLGNSVMMKDLLSSLELERMGLQKALLKGYTKLKE